MRRNKAGSNHGVSISVVLGCPVELLPEELPLVAIAASIAVAFCGLWPRDRVHALLGPGFVLGLPTSFAITFCAVDLVVAVAVGAAAAVFGPLVATSAVDFDSDAAAVLGLVPPVCEMNTTSSSSPSGA
jgi:hypothetical protein